MRKSCIREVSFLGTPLMFIKVYVKGSQKSFEKATEGMPYVNIPFWSWSIIFFQKKIFRGRKTDFRWFFRTQKLKKSIFKGFMKNHDFRPKIMTWGLTLSHKNIFFEIFFLKTFFICKKPSDWYFYICHKCFQSKVINSNVHPIFGFSRFSL